MDPGGSYSELLLSYAPALMALASFQLVVALSLAVLGIARKFALGLAIGSAVLVATGGAAFYFAPLLDVNYRADVHWLERLESFGGVVELHSTVATLAGALVLLGLGLGLVTGRSRRKALWTAATTQILLLAGLCGLDRYRMAEPLDLRAAEERVLAELQVTRETHRVMVEPMGVEGLSAVYLWDHGWRDRYPRVCLSDGYHVWCASDDHDPGPLQAVVRHYRLGSRPPGLTAYETLNLVCGALQVQANEAFGWSVVRDADGNTRVQFTQEGFLMLLSSRSLRSARVVFTANDELRVWFGEWSILRRD